MGPIYVKIKLIWKQIVFKTAGKYGLGLLSKEVKKQFYL